MLPPRYRFKTHGSGVKRVARPARDYNCKLKGSKAFSLFGTLLVNAGDFVAEQVEEQYQPSNRGFRVPTEGMLFWQGAMKAFREAMPDLVDTGKYK